MKVVQSEVHGERGTGFEKAGDKGPFECGNCGFYRDGCTQPTMKSVSRQPRLRNGNVDVDEHDCCEYVDRKGDGEMADKKKKKHLHEIRTVAAKDGSFAHFHRYKNHPDDEDAEPERMVATSESPEEAGQHVQEQMAMNQPQEAGPPDAEGQEGEAAQPGMGA